MFRLTFSILFALIFFQAAGQEKVRIVSYNVENLFDLEDMPKKNDNAFLPTAKREWTEERYQKKLLGIAKTLVAIGEWEPLALVGLCEVENDKVLMDLINTAPIKKHNYSIIHHESPDARGIDVALLYDPNSFEPLYDEAIPLVLRKTRDILYVKGVLKKKDTLHVFMNHWPSRVGGQHETEFKRMKASATLQQRVDSIFAIDSLSKVLVMGDFNDTPEDKSILSLCKDSLLINGMEDCQHPGTYKFRGNWDYLDQFLFSKSLQERVKADVFMNPFLLKEGEQGKTPFRTYQGTIYKGGVSDHLPIYIDLLLN